MKPQVQVKSSYQEGEISQISHHSWYFFESEFHAQQKLPCILMGGKAAQVDRA